MRLRDFTRAHDTWAKKKDNSKPSLYIWKNFLKDVQLALPHLDKNSPLVDKASKAESLLEKVTVKWESKAANRNGGNADQKPAANAAAKPAVQAQPNRAANADAQAKQNQQEEAPAQKA
jgi:hypothetical protein